MANRYWVGGADNWNTTAGSKWSTTSGGAGGSAVPTAADDVYFDNYAGAGNVVVTNAATCRSLNFVDGTGGAYTGTFTVNTGIVITIGDGTTGAGNVGLKLSGSATYSYGNSSSGYTLTNSSGTEQSVTCNGKSAGAFIVNNSSAVVGLADNMTAQSCTVSGGTFKTNNHSMTLSLFNYGNATTRTIDFGSSTITCTNNSSMFSGTNVTNLTVVANTATVICAGAVTSTNNVFLLFNKDWNGLSFSITGGGQAALNFGGTSARIKNLTITGTASQLGSYRLSNDLTLSSGGTFTVTGNSAVNRPLIYGASLGTANSISCDNVSLTNVDFRDITGSGSASWAGTTIGDRLGNSGITFTTPATQTRDSTSGSAWSVAARWTSRVPLPQDDVVLNASSGNISSTDVAVLGKSIDASGYAGTITGTSTNTPYEFYGDISLGGTFTQPNTFYLYAYGRGSHTITSNGKTMWGGSSNNRFYIFSPGNSYTLADAFYTRAGSGSTLAVLGVFAGTFDSANYSITTAQLQSVTTTYARAITLGTSTVTLFGLAAQTCVSMAASNLTFSGANATFNVTGTTSATKTWAGGGQTFGTVNNTASGGLLYVSDTGNTFTNYNQGAGTGLRVVAGGTLTFTNSPTLTGQNYGYQRFWTAPGSGAGASAFVSAPDSAALSITGNIDIRAYVSMDDWTPSSIQAFVAKWDTNNNRSFSFRMETTGRISLVISTGGVSVATTNTSSVATGFTDGTGHWVRATLNTATTTVKIYTSNDPASTTSPTWTQLGADITGASASIFDGAARLTIGGQDYQSLTPGSPLLGNVYRAQMRNNILDDGTGIQFDADFTTKTFGADSFTEGSSNAATVTIDNNATYGDGRIGLDTQTGGSAATIKKTGTGIFGEYDYLTLKDIRILEPYSFFGKTTSVDKTGNKNVNFTVKPSAPERRQGKYTSSSTSTCVITFDYTPTLGNLLVVVARTDTTGTYTTPAGWARDKLNTDNNANSIIYSKVSDGTETGVTLTSTSTPQWRTMFMEYSGFSGTATLEQTDGNSGTSVTTLSSGAGVTNAGTAMGVAIFSHLTSTSLGSFTNSWQEEFIMSDSTTGASVVVKPLTASASQSTTKSWASAANTTSALALYNSVLASNGNFLMFM